MNSPIFTKFSIALIMLFLLAPHAYGTALIIDSSTSEVKVSSSFIGTDVMVFGTANDKDDIIVVITGPTETAIVRKKGRVSGIWINKEKLEFREIPGFYAIASTRPAMRRRSIKTRPGALTPPTPATIANRAPQNPKSSTTQWHR